MHIVTGDLYNIDYEQSSDDLLIQGRHDRSHYSFPIDSINCKLSYG